MSYKESNIKCDWCREFIYDGEDVACQKCYEKLEQYIADLEKEIEVLRKGE